MLNTWPPLAIIIPGSDFSCSLLYVIRAADAPESESSE